MAATQGFPLVSSRRKTCESLRLSSNSIEAAASSPCVFAIVPKTSISRSSNVRSAPAQNVALAEVTTAPLMAASATTFSTSAASSSMTSTLMTFIERPAMSQVSSAMPSASTSKVKLLMCAVPSPSIRCAVSVQIAAALFVAFHDQIDVGIMHALGPCACADFEIDRDAVGTIEQPVRVAAAGLESRGVAGLEHDLDAVLRQHQFTFQYINEFVFLLMPVPQRGSRTRVDARNVDAELREAHGIADCLFVTAAAFGWIGSAAYRLHLVDIDFRHASPRSNAFDDRGRAHAGADAQRDKRGIEV